MKIPEHKDDHKQELRIEPGKSERWKAAHASPASLPLCWIKLQSSRGVAWHLAQHRMPPAESSPQQIKCPLSDEAKPKHYGKEVFRILGRLQHERRKSSSHILLNRLNCTVQHDFLLRKHGMQLTSIMNPSL